MAFNMQSVRGLLHVFDFKTLFIEQLGWSNPANPRPTPLACDGATFTLRQIAQLAGVVVLEVVAPDGKMPDARTRAAIYKQIAPLIHENLLIFLDRAPQPTQSLWYWVKRAGTKRSPREHLYMRGQPGDLFISKIGAMFVDISDLDAEGQIAVVEVARRLQAALDVEQVTKEFYTRFKEQRLAFLDAIAGIEDERDRQWYVSVLLNRLMFIYFLQRKGFLDQGDLRYLQHKLEACRAQGADRYYAVFLRPLFFEGFARQEDQRDPAIKTLLGQVRYLNGGLFLEHPVEQRWPNITIPDQTFAALFALFERFSWNLDDTPGGQDDELNPDVLGYIFEKYINQKAFGAYYTRTEITEYLCEQTIHELILDQVNTPAIPGLTPGRHFASLNELLMNLDAPLCRELIQRILPYLSLLDPACGSGAFLVAAMKTLIDIYSAVIGRIDFLPAPDLRQWLKEIRAAHPSLGYYIKKRIITDNLFGVDIMEEATEIARLRLFLALVTSVTSVEELEPLPNIDFNILAGNSLVGLLHVDEDEYNRRHPQMAMFQQSYHQVLAEKNRLLATYRHTADLVRGAPIDLRALRDDIQAHREAANATLNDILRDEFARLGIRYEQATWDAKAGQAGKPTRRALAAADITGLHPFHWGYEFDQVFARGGFDAVITNPPWEIFKPNGKEFFAEYSDLVTKNKMRIEDFEKEQDKLLQDPEIRAAWLEYLSRFPHVSAFFRATPQYANQISLVNGKKAGTDINLYKLFIEQCFNLLRSGGRCGIIVQGSIYSDLGAKQLREMLFSHAQLDTLFGVSNERFIFEGVDHRMKLCILVFEKGGATEAFTAAFRIDPREAVKPSKLDDFLNNKTEHMRIPVELVRRLSPDSLSVMEFKTPLDVQIAEKLLQFPLLGDTASGAWVVQFTREVNNTSDMKYINSHQEPKYVHLYEGKMIHQYNHNFEAPRYFIDIERFNRENSPQLNGKYPSDFYRLCFRRQARSSDTYTFIGTIAPKVVLFFDNLAYVMPFQDGRELLKPIHNLYLLPCLNSFPLQFLLRQQVNANLSFYLLYQLPVPRLTAQDPAFGPIVERAAKLICTTPEFDALAREAGLPGHQAGVTDPAERAQLRAELDGMIAHLYGLTEAEFQHILGTFPLVDPAVKAAALAAYRDLAPNPDAAQLAALIAAGEGAWVEFKVGAKASSEKIMQAVASFLNKEGGKLFIGVTNTGQIAGIEHDFAAVDPQKPGPDTYELYLRNLFADHLRTTTNSTPAHLNCFAISFPQVQGHTLCLITVQPAPEPIYLDGDLYVRSGNQKRKLKAAEVLPYIRQHWPGWQGT